MNLPLICKVSTYEWYNFWGLDNAGWFPPRITGVAPGIGEGDSTIKYKFIARYNGYISVHPLLNLLFAYFKFSKLAETLS